MLFGVSYYYEYQPYERLDDDVRIMRDAGINYVRLGDAAWARCEPVEGRFDLDWLARVLDKLHESGIQVVLCTPTYAIPPWLWRRHPEIMFQANEREVASYGARQNVDISHPSYRYYAERITRRVFERYARHPAVTGFQVDNETGSRLALNRDVFAAFVDHLKDKFGTVERLNEVWGLNYWSHRLGEWADLWPPEPMRQMPGSGPKSGNSNPGYELEWRRFHLGVTTGFLVWLRDIVREYATEQQFVTHDIVGGHGRIDADRYQIAQAMDVSAENLQHPSQDGLLHPPVPSVSDHGVAQGTGPAVLYMRADMARGGRQSNFLVTEFNARGPGRSSNNFPYYDGQARLTAYACISRGADAITYWHWHTLHYGWETYAQGVLGHGLEANRFYREISRLGHDLSEHSQLLTELRPDAEVAFVYSQDSRMALRFHPCLKRPGGSDPDPQSYEHIFDAFYRAYFDARAQAAVVHPAQDFEQYPVVVAPALYVADDALLERLVRYAEGGGHLVLSFRSGYADEHGRARWQPAPGPLRKAVGATYAMYSNLEGPLGLHVPAGGPTLPPESQVAGWADELELEGGTALAYYEHPHFGHFPAVVTQQVGTGQVTYLGTLPDAATGRAIAEWVLASAGVRTVGTDLPEPVRMTTARARDGRRLSFLGNWSMQALTVPAAAQGTEVLSGRELGRTDRLTLQPWDVAIVASGGWDA